MTKSLTHHITIDPEMMDIIEKSLSETYDIQMLPSKLMGDQLVPDKRNSKNAWVPTVWWLGGLMWHYFKKANDEVFHYDLDHIDGESMQYTQYAIGERYDWHIDEGLSNLYKPQAGGMRNTDVVVQDWVQKNALRVRKLSCILQLAHGDDYEGGATQVRDVDQSLYTVPRERGTLVFFDSRLHHRAKTVHKGLRKSLICWAVGPRWR